MKTFIAVSTLLIILSAVNFAQPKKGNVGLSVAIQKTQFSFLVPLFLNDNLSFSPSLGIVHISDRYTDLSLGGELKYYISKNVVSPFIGGGIGVQMFSPSGLDTETDITFGILFGGEHYFTQNFSAGIDIELNFAKSGEKSNRFNNPGGTTVNTASVIFATIYF